MHKRLTLDDSCELIGKEFGRLKVVAYGGRVKKAHHYLCTCSCGNYQIRFINRRSLMDNRTTSCGCFHAERLIKDNIIHGFSSGRANGNGHPLHQVYKAMIGRCHNPNIKAYPWYGGRGIKVCDAWRSDFMCFVNDMGPRTAGMSIDRIDNNGDYEPSNCRWATARTQSTNKRTTRYLTYNGKTQCIKDWADELGIGDTVIIKRLSREWSIEDALTTRPSRTNSKKRNGGRPGYALAAR